MKTITSILRIILNYVLASYVCRGIVYLLGGVAVALFGDVAWVPLLIVQLVVLIHPKTRRLMSLTVEFFLHGVMSIVSKVFGVANYTGPQYAR